MPFEVFWRDETKFKKSRRTIISASLPSLHCRLGGEEGSLGASRVASEPRSSLLTLQQHTDIVRWLQRKRGSVHDTNRYVCMIALGTFILLREELLNTGVDAICAPRAQVVAQILSGGLPLNAHFLNSMSQGEALPDLLEGCDPQPAAKALVEKLKRVDLVPLLRQLQSERGLPLEAAKAHIQELLRFLVLKALARDGEERGSKLTLSPSFLVDQAWHELLLRPRLYADVCSALGCAHVIDHDPLGGKVRAAATSHACALFRPILPDTAAKMSSAIHTLGLAGAPPTSTGPRAAQAPGAHQGRVLSRVRRRSAGRHLGRGPPLGCCSSHGCCAGRRARGHQCVPL